MKDYLHRAQHNFSSWRKSLLAKMELRKRQKAAERRRRKLEEAQVGAIIYLEEEDRGVYYCELWLKTSPNTFNSFISHQEFTLEEMVEKFLKRNKDP